MMTFIIGIIMKMIFKRENIEMMRERHEKEIASLQSKCKHKDISDWQEFHWAVGHFSHYVKVCLFCGKIVKKDIPKFKPMDFKIEKTTKVI